MAPRLLIRERYRRRLLFYPPNRRRNLCIHPPARQPVSRKNSPKISPQRFVTIPDLWFPPLLSPCLGRRFFIPSSPRFSHSSHGNAPKYSRHSLHRFLYPWFPHLHPQRLARRSLRRQALMHWLPHPSHPLRLPCLRHHPPSNIRKFSTHLFHSPLAPRHPLEMWSPSPPLPRCHRRRLHRCLFKYSSPPVCHSRPRLGNRHLL